MSTASSFDRVEVDAGMQLQHRAAEPSMEEILASIRRIIADDDALPLAPRPGPRLVDPPSAGLALPAAPVLTLVTPAQDPAPVPRPQVIQEPIQEDWHEARDDNQYYSPAPLVSADTHIAVQSSFDALAATVMVQNSAMIEENIRAMLRPLLKSWLDDNLPVIVEKLVRSEIERVARGGR